MKNNIFKSKKENAAKEEISINENQTGITPYCSEVNTYEGIEFLDDAIRFEDQPYSDNAVKGDK